MDKDELTYLDYNASAPARPEVGAVMMESLSQTGNASSVHAAGRSAYNQLSEARRQIASLVSALPEQVIFTSGGTESNFMAIKGAVSQPRGDKSIKHILVGSTEHPSVLAAAQDTGLPCDIIPVDDQGVIDLNALEDLLEKTSGPALICVMMANNETGCLQPLGAIAEMAEKYNGFVHVDAVQGMGKLDFSGLGFNLCSTGTGTSGIVSLSFSAHKIGGPQGVGALILKDGYTITPLLSGGGQEQGRRSGTENMPGIAGFGVAASLAETEKEAYISKVSLLRERLEAGLLKVCPETIVFSERTERLVNTSCFAIPGLLAEKALINFDLEKVCVSSGSACSSGKVSQSHVLRAMNVEGDIAACALRVSLGWQTSKEDIENFITALTKILGRVQKREHKNEVA